MDGMDWMASAMRAAQAQLETATHNLANVASDGFRRIRSSLTLTGHGLVVRESPEKTQGGIRETGRTLDVALLGPGSFHVGTAQETRNEARSFATVTAISPTNEAAVSRAIPSGPFQSLRERDDRPGRHRPATTGGSSLGRTTAGRTERSFLQRGASESSSVDAIGETLAVLTAQRAFETAQKTLVAIDHTREKAVNDVGEVQPTK